MSQNVNPQAVIPLTAEEVKRRLLKIPNLDIFVNSYEIADKYIVVDLNKLKSDRQLGSNLTIENGSEIKFIAPENSKELIGLRVIYSTAIKVCEAEFTFADAAGGEFNPVNNLFTDNTLVKVILDLDSQKAFVQNAATSTYLEEHLDRLDELETAITGLETIDKGLQDQIDNLNTEDKRLASLLGELRTDVDKLPSQATTIQLINWQDGDSWEDLATLSQEEVN